MTYVFTVCFVGGELRHSYGLSKESAESLYEAYESDTLEDVAWFGFKPTKEG